MSGYEILRKAEAQKLRTLSETQNAVSAAGVRLTAKTGLCRRATLLFSPSDNVY